MKATSELTDIELRSELAELLGWSRLEVGATGVLFGRMPGFHSFGPLAVPRWVDNPHDCEDLEELLERKSLTHEYRGHLRAITGAGVDGSAEFLGRLRCEAALTSLRLMTAFTPHLPQ